MAATNYSCQSVPTFWRLEAEFWGDDEAVNVSLLENIEYLSFSGNNGGAQVQTALLLQLTNEE